MVSVDFANTFNHREQITAIKGHNSRLPSSFVDSGSRRIPFRNVKVALLPHFSNDVKIPLLGPINPLFPQRIDVLHRLDLPMKISQRNDEDCFPLFVLAETDPILSYLFLEEIFSMSLF